ncbi:glycosyltransferase [Hanstruepera flava]|uniref:glycosyltransferase n=1 Tax=Hanstruepera flava TaxID=2930218 RepID=UPI002028A370|nr:glycosyltransferase [Hanstruepera flava]
MSSLGEGGAERSSALLSEILDGLGYDVYIVSIQNNITYSYKGKLFNLGALFSTKRGFLKKIKKGRLFISYLKEHNFDYIIDNRSRNLWLREFIISNFIYSKYKTVYVVRSYNLDYSFSKIKFLAKLNYKRASAIVGVSNEIKSKIEKEFVFKNVVAIQNPVEINGGIFEKQDNLLEYILCYGRLEEKVKNYSLLLSAFKLSRLPNRNIKLVILGTGPDLSLLMNKVEELKLTRNVIFKPFTENPFEIVKNAIFVCLSSRFEGFPRVLIESLSLGTPVISVDCKSGPSEIIKNKENGLLVENFNAKALADAMDSFIFNSELYDFCKSNAVKSVKKYSTSEIAKKWQTLLNSIK